MTASPAETEALAARLAARLRAGDVVAVSGELGAGKTTFVRGAARALGVAGPVSSPTFTIGHRYEAPTPVAHLDLYRITGLDAEEWGDLEPYFDGTVAFVEWPEHGGRLAAAARATVTLRARRRVAPPRSDRRVKTILAFDTATSFGAVCGLATGARVRARAGRRRAAARSTSSSTTRASSTGSSSAAGPGSFTSIRIGLAVARALAFALDVPVAGASTLDAFGGGTPVIDAQRGEVFTSGRASAAGGARRGRADARRRRRGALPRRCSRRRARSCRPTTTTPTSPIRSAPARARRARSARRRSSSRSTSASRTRGRWHDRGRRPDPPARSSSDLDAIEVIERRAYPTPWSRSMFASELAKPTSICLGAFEGDELVGYVVNSRYVDAWHVMNVAVEPEHQRRGIATRCSSGCSSWPATTSAAGTRSRCASRTKRRSDLYEQLGFDARGIRRGYYTDNREDALIMWRDARRPTASDPRDRDVVRRDSRGRRHRGRRDPARTSSPRRRSCTLVSAAWCRRLRPGATSSWSRPCSSEALDEAGATSTTSTRSPSRSGRV